LSDSINAITETIRSLLPFIGSPPVSALSQALFPCYYYAPRHLLGIVLFSYPLYTLFTGPARPSTNEEIKMNQKDANAIRQAAEWLSYQSVSSSGDSQASITKADLDNFKAKIVQTLLMIAENDE